MRYITETRNLFPTSTAVGTLSGWSQSYARQFEEDKWYIGISGNNYYAPENIIDYELTENYVYINAMGSGYGIGKAFKCEPNQTYTVSCKWIKNTAYFKIATGFYDENGNRLYSIGSGNLAVRHTFTTPANCKWFTVCFTAINKGSTYVYNIQLEEGSTATPYVPYGYLPMYKGKYKVSNVCQLLDKSKYPATITKYGITFTNNGDGTITVNGTATSDIGIELLNQKADEGHKYLVSGCPSNGGYGSYRISASIGDSSGNYINGFSDKGDGNISPIFEEGQYIMVSISIWPGVNASNLTFKPQLFDLTEMYGAGHEPTTVEEFRSKFPNDLYEYSPYCWAPMKNIRYLEKTKNLFDIYSYENISNSSNITINGNSILCVARAANAHVLYKIPTVIGEKYTVSNKSVVRGGLVNTGKFGLMLSDNPSIDSSNYLTYGLQSGQSFTLTASSEFLYIHWYVCYNFDSNNPSTIEINELQVELGDTATPYVPYGYLPLK